MGMRVNYNIDLSAFRPGTVRFTASFSGFPGKAALCLPALLAKTGVAVKELKATGLGGKKLRVKVSGDKIFTGAADFTLTYSLKISLKESVGTGLEVELLYPFLNASEIFLGSGTLPFPEQLAALGGGLRAELRLAGLPPGWGVFSSIPEGPVSPGNIDSFYIYCSKGQAPQSHIYKGLSGRTEFALLVQKGKTIPYRPAEIWKITDHAMCALEKSLGPYGGSPRVNILILQPPADFGRIMRGATFATGENLLGGVAAYTPKSPAYIREKFGHGSYAHHLRDGLTHELTHYYFTTAWQGRFKSLLFPSDACPPRHQQLLGESMTGYFHEGIVRCGSGAKPSFISGKILPLLAAWKAAPRKKPVLDLFLLDQWLRSNGSSLKAAVNLLLEEYGRRHRPYRSANVLTRVAETCARARLPSCLRKSLLTPYVPDYAAELENFPGWDRKDFSPLV